MSNQPTWPTGNYNNCLDNQVAVFSPEGRRLLQHLLEYEAHLASQIPLYPAELPLSHPEYNGNGNDDDYYNGIEATIDGMTDTNNNGFLHPEPQWAIAERERALQARVMDLDVIINEFLTVRTLNPAPTVSTQAMANLTLVEPPPGFAPPFGFDFDFQQEQAPMPVFSTTPPTFMDWFLATQHDHVAHPLPFIASANDSFMGVSPEEHAAMTARLNREVEGVRALVASLGIARTARLALDGDDPRTVVASRTTSRNPSVVSLPPPPSSPSSSSSSSDDDDDGEYQDGDLTANYLEYLVGLGLRAE